MDQVRNSILSILVVLLYIMLNKMNSHPPNFSECWNLSEYKT